MEGEEDLLCKGGEDRRVILPQESVGEEIVLVEGEEDLLCKGGEDVRALLSQELVGEGIVLVECEEDLFCKGGEDERAGSCQTGIPFPQIVSAVSHLQHSLTLCLGPSSLSFYTVW